MGRFGIGHKARRIMMRFLFVMLLILLLGGCALSDLGQAHSGGAVYEYEKTTNSDGTSSCSARATSSREIMGVGIKIGGDCSFETTLEEATSPFEVIDRVLDLVPTPVQ